MSRPIAQLMLEAAEDPVAQHQHLHVPKGSGSCSKVPGVQGLGFRFWVSGLGFTLKGLGIRV